MEKDTDIDWKLIIIVVIIGVVVLGGIYFGKQYYQNFQQQNKKQQDLLSEQQKELERTKQEISNMTDAQKVAQAAIEKAQKTATGAQSSAAASQKLAEEAQAKLQQERTNNPDLSSVITQWRPRIAYIECEFRYSDSGVLYAKGAGSGILAKWGAGNTAILTNKHVLTDENGYGPNTCYATFSDINKTYTFINNYTSGIPIGTSNDSLDWGLLTIESPDSHIGNITSSVIISCVNKPSLGDKVVILGYPTIGSVSTITATEGIISGYDGNYFITDAKIEHGNSGGAAILLKDNCYLGIPSYVLVGNVESLARILDANVIWDSK